MAIIKPFKCIRPSVEYVSKVAALPYDVYNRAEAKEVVKKEPYSFLKIDRAETQFEDSVSTYDPRVYKKAKELLNEMIKDKILIQDEDNAYYIYELIMNGRHQTGIVATSSIDDYLNNVIKKHENTREEKEIDRINHVDITSAQTGPIFLAYRNNDSINKIVNNIKQTTPLYSFTSDDSITHNVWKITSEVEKITSIFATIPNTYIADGHHRCASAVKVGLKRRKENPNYTGNEEFNYFLSVLFPDSELMIMDYNRTVRDLNNLPRNKFLDKLSENFEFDLIDKANAYPKKKGEFGMYLNSNWYRMKAKKELLSIKDPVKSLDVSILQDYVLSPLLGIKDPRTDNRIDFIGGIRGIEELEKRANSDMVIAFLMHPTSISELFDVADKGLLMPPKSTWFEPKLRSGIFIHKI